jgi:hypothetical protein
MRACLIRTVRRERVSQDIEERRIVHEKRTVILEEIWENHTRHNHRQSSFHTKHIVRSCLSCRAILRQDCVWFEIRIDICVNSFCFYYCFLRWPLNDSRSLLFDYSNKYTRFDTLVIRFFLVLIHRANSLGIRSFAYWLVSACRLVCATCQCVSRCPTTLILSHPVVLPSTNNVDSLIQPRLWQGSSSILPADTSSIISSVFSLSLIVEHFSRNA